MQLMDQRAHGYVSTEQVEAAVSSVLGSLGAIPPKGPPPAKARTRRKASESWTQPATTTISTSTSIQVDQGNYDDDDDEDEAEINKNSTQNDSDKHHPESTQQSPLSSFSAAAAALDTPFMTTIGSNNDPTQIMSLKEYQELLKEIPMGKVGAQMMTAFGDGSRPNIEALKLALEGTRRALQYIVMDARALRRRIKLQYSQAQLETLAGKKSIAGTSTSTTNNVTADNPATTISATTSLAHTMATTTDPSLAYRAILIDEAAMHDPLGRHPPCGFDVEQLARLYPEELQAYDRWNELHEEYEHPNPVEVDGDTDKSKTTTRTTSPTTTTNNQEEEEENDYLGGHLKERVAVFNIRTDHMPQDMYLHFSRIRQGSFLPRGRGRQQTQLEREWDSLEVRKGRGRGGTWLHMPAITVRFLHWLGFQPPEVPPPDTETTQVLAFLGHDRMGRIVEKAIQLRNFRLGKDALEFRELPPWEQLTVEEIQAALDDPDVKPAPLFPFDDNPNHGICLPNVQLYFGPGFEQRLELELEEYVMFGYSCFCSCCLENQLLTPSLLSLSLLGIGE